MLFDAHTHLNFEEFSAEERAALAAEIASSAVRYIIDVGDSVASSEQAVRDAEAYSWCYAAVGIHPHYAAKTTEEDLARIERLAAHEKVRAIGEIGLDFYYGKETKEAQIALFRKQIRLANRLVMPIMVHTRDADELTLEILKEEGAFDSARRQAFPQRPDGKGGFCEDARVQLHCYSGAKELAREYVRLGATISIGGPLTFKNARKSVEVVEALPLAFVLSETDAPYLAPVPMRGKQNKSPYIEHVVRRMALIKGIAYEDAAAVTLENGKRFFAIG